MVASPGVITLLKASLLRPQTVCSGGNPRSGFPDQTMASPSVSFTLLRASFWNTNYLEGVSWRSGVSSATSMSVRLGGMALRGLDFGLMDSHMVALSGIVAMPTADLILQGHGVDPF